MAIHKYLPAWAFLAGILAAGVSYAAGTVDFVSGNVVIYNARNEMRVPQANERVDEGDTVITGQDGEAQIVTDDKGIIALRPGTQLQFDTYRAAGRNDDAVVLRLLRGSFRSVAGWIGQKGEEHFRIITPTATIRAGAADHEVAVVEGGPDAGTYDKVNSGHASLGNELGSYDVTPRQAGFAPKSGANPPAALSAVPGFLRPAANESQIDGRLAALAQQRDQALRQQLQSNIAAGGGTTEKPKLGTFEDQQKALMALEELFRYYEAGNVNFLRNRLDPSMIGFQPLLDHIAQETTQCKQMRIRIYDTQVQAGPDLAIIQTNWEKRCLLLPAFTPRIDTGFSTFLMHKGKSGWGMAALSGDNPFERTGTLGTIRLGSFPSCLQIASLAAPTPLPVSITVFDPDLAGSPTTSVTLTTSEGDSETVTLTAAGGGVFTTNTLSFSYRFGRPVSNNGIIDIARLRGITPVCPSVTVIYTDTTTPTGLPQTVQGTVQIR